MCFFQPINYWLLFIRFHHYLSMYFDLLSIPDARQKTNCEDGQFWPTLGSHSLPEVSNLHQFLIIYLKWVWTWVHYRKTLSDNWITNFQVWIENRWVKYEKLRNIYFQKPIIFHSSVFHYDEYDVFWFDSKNKESKYWHIRKYNDKSDIF